MKKYKHVAQQLQRKMCYDDYYEVDDATWDYVESWFEGASA